MKMIDETGNVYGQLTVMYRVADHISNSGRKRIYWHCKCSCGNEKDICIDSLRYGLTKSCGCIRKENAKNLNKKDLINLRFGKLLVLEDTNKIKNNYHIWKCLCDCGNICYVTTNNLTMGHTISCGCLSHKSKGEEKIISLLKEHNIPFETEKIFNDCYFVKNGKMRFDFYVNNKYLIEYDGIQHFIDKNNGWDESLLEIQKRDNYKNQYCREKNIPLIRIPYFHYEELSIDDLILETSKYIID